MSQVNVLFRLQQIDNEIRQRKERLTEVMRAQKESSELKTARQTAADASEALTALRKKQRLADQELNQNRLEIETSQTRLYSGDVQNPKELADLQRRIGNLQNRQAQLEDEILELLILGEEAEAAEKGAQASLSTIESAWKAASIEFKDEQHTVALALSDWMNKRKEVIRLVQPQNIATYDRLAQKRGGVAVASIKRGSCTGCQVRVSAGVASQVAKGEMVYCPNCGRILSHV